MASVRYDSGRGRKGETTSTEVKVKVKSLSRVRLFATPWTAAHQAPPSMRFSRQEYWSGLPFPSPGDLPDPGIEPRSPTLQVDALTSAFPQARRGDIRPNDQAKGEKDQGGFIFKGKFVDAIRGKVSQAGRFGYSLVEMAFVVEQGVGGFGQGVISPRYMQQAQSNRVGPKVQFCFP